MKRQSFQQGSVVRRERKRGPDVWVFYHRDNGKQVPHRIGTVEKYPTKASAEKAATKIRRDINGQREHVYMRDLLKTYQEDDLSVRDVTAASYRSNIKRIRERWGDTRLDVMAKDMMGIEQWLNNLTTMPTTNKPARPLAKKSRTNLKALLHRIFERAIFLGKLEIQRNPISLVEVKGKSGRVRKLVPVTLEAYHKMLADPEFEIHAKTMVMIAFVLGLRASEVLGLRWDDFDYGSRMLRVQRSVVGKSEDDTKSPESTQDVPLHPEFAELIQGWRDQMKPIEGWFFGNPNTGRPYWRDSLLEDHIEPAGRRAGVPGIGWHSFRHHYRSLMAELGEELEVQQRLMRHSDIRITMSYGDQSMDKRRRGANERIFEVVRRSA